jgi:hypothetical protein
VSVAEHKEQKAQSSGNVRKGAGSAAIAGGSSGPDRKTIEGKLVKEEWFGRQPPTAPRAMREGLQPPGRNSSNRSSMGRDHPEFHTRIAPKLDQIQSTATPRLKFDHQPAINTGNSGSRSTGSRKRPHSSSRGSQGGLTGSQLPAAKRQHIDEQDQSVGAAL